MQHQGPPLERLTRRLAETPAEFRAEPRIGEQSVGGPDIVQVGIVQVGVVQVAAVLRDVLDDLGLGFAWSPADFEPFLRVTPGDRNRLALTLLVAWLLADPDLSKATLPPAGVRELLVETTGELAKRVAAQRFVDDPDRREELVRTVLAHLDLRPAGESLAQAQDRLTLLSTTERQRVLRAAQAAEKRARAVREALARKAAEESADKWTRE